ncbi:enoyl-CoA hydratase/isomerase family protein [Staphylococcus epidermidis]|uniref:enoyl-CoA hydratase/isomerase family protein n=3 Tax=Staphylococcus TaxID=1279 RepID=UPI0021A7A2CA|nr:enoyl-CoA hydratase/isomerase family protein [Staphylococcus epidermidis]MCT1513176.1 enoyl-CoA hydratase/isomerase family protein [Staphylococcus epidermidis]
MKFIDINYDNTSKTQTIYLNSKENQNSLTYGMAKELLQSIKNANNSRSIKSIVFLSQHRAFFSKGPDIKDLLNISLNKNLPFFEEMLDLLNDIILEIYNSPKTTIVGYNGLAYGGGLNLFLGCDLRFATIRTKVIENFGDMGLSLDLGSSFFLPRLIGQTQTMSILLLERIITADKLQSTNLFNKIFHKNSEMKKEIHNICNNISTKDNDVLYDNKNLIKHNEIEILKEHLFLEKKRIIHNIQKDETRQRLNILNQKAKGE